jgi:DNA-binding IclR family transcriptional regulator
VKCLKCGFENRPRARFCKQCGQALQVASPARPPSAGATCPACGAVGDSDARFCRQCGKPLAAAPAMAPTEPALPTSVHIEGGVSGQVAIGNNILQIGNVHGGVVNVMMPGQKVQPQPRPTPVDLRPRPFPDLLDRETEVKTTTAALQSAKPVEFHAAAGLGKTALLRHLAHHPTAATFPDGVVYLSARRQPVDDIIQSLYNAFYTSDAPYKPTDAQLKHDLQNMRALILLDDVELAREDAEKLMNVAPTCAFLMGSQERRLWGEGQSLALEGLPPGDAIALIERELGRSLTPEERPVAQELCTSSKGSPLALIQMAAETREKGLLLTELKAQERKQEGARTTDLLEFPRQQMQLIRHITRQGETTVEAAAKHLGETPANTRQMLDALLERGYLERVERKGGWAYKMRFARKQARWLPLGIWSALEQEAKGAQAPSLAGALNALPAAERQVLATLAALGGTPVHAEHLAALTELPDAASTLQALSSRGIVQSHSPRYTLTGGLEQAVQQVWNLTPWMERALAYFAGWAEGQQHAPERLLEEADAILRILEWAVSAGRWTDVLRLGRAIEGALALGGRWAAWAQALQWMLQAGQALGDQAAESWALHQLGTRSLCLSDNVAARTFLTQALQLREALGDHAGAAITKHNLSLIPAAPPTPPKKPPTPKTRPPLPKWLLPAAGIVTVGGIAAVVGAVLIIISGTLPTPVPPTERPLEATEPPTTIPTVTPTKTPTLTPTKTPTLTPTEKPWITIDLDDGCDREYTHGDESLLTVETNVGGPIKIWLDDRVSIGSAVLGPGEVWDRNWTFTDISPGKHKFRAVLMDSDGSTLAKASCTFTLVPACLDFEDLATDEYVEGDEFSSAGVKISVIDGEVAVVPGGQVGDSGREIDINDGTLQFHFDRSLGGLSLGYSQVPYVTPIAILEINDDAWGAGLMDSADGEIIGGVTVSAGDGVLRLDGRINSFIIGGTDLYIDDVCLW